MKATKVIRRATGQVGRVTHDSTDRVAVTSEVNVTLYDRIWVGTRKQFEAVWEEFDDEQPKRGDGNG